MHMKNSVNIYLSNRYDTDLIELLSYIGKKNFLRLTKASLLALNNPKYVGNVTNYLIAGTDMPPMEKGCIRLQLSLMDIQYYFIQELLTHIKDRKQSAFIKQVIRYYLGPIHLLPHFFKEDVNIQPQQLYTPLVLNGVKNSTPKIVRQVRVVTQSQTTEPTPIISTPQPSMSESTQSLENPSVMEPYSYEEDSTLPMSEEDEILSLLTNMLS